MPVTTALIVIRGVKVFIRENYTFRLVSSEKSLNFTTYFKHVKWTVCKVPFPLMYFKSHKNDQFARYKRFPAKRLGVARLKTYFPTKIWENNHNNPI